jgi:hypothetical protein
MTHPVPPRYPLFGLAALVVLGLGCGGKTQCSDCPPLAGTWDLELGPPGLLPPGCEGVTIVQPTGPLLVNQVGSSLSAVWERVSLQGAVYDSWDFSLNGTADGALTLSVNGRYAPATGPQHPERLVGTLTQSQRQDAQTCTLGRSYTGMRRP